MAVGDLEINERAWHIELNGRGVEHLFDAQGSETLDPTQAVEVKLVDAAHLAPINENDVLTFTLLMDGTHG
jgi:hypothetical protein